MKSVHAMVHIMKFLEEEDFMNLDIHETKALYHMFWAFGFGSSYACTTNFYVDNFAYHDAIITWTKDKMWKGILGWTWV